MHKILSRLHRQFFSSEPSAVDAEPRAGALSAAAAKRAVQELLDELPERGDAKLVQVLALIGNDQLDAAERALGKREDEATTYLRGVIQRRRGAYAEACRCFRLSREWAVLLQVGEAVQASSDPMVQRVLDNFPNLIQDGRFQAAPMCGVVQQVCQGGHASLQDAVRTVQGLELGAIFDYLAGKGHRRLQAMLRQRGVVT